MVRIFKHYVPGSVLWLGLAEAALLAVAIYLGILIRVTGFGRPWNPILNHPHEIVVFVAVLSLTMIALGLYQKQHLRDMGRILLRLVVSFLVAFVVLSLLFYMFPSIEVWRSATTIAFVIALAGTIAIRWAFLHLVDLRAFRRRIVVLGTGEHAAKIVALEQDERVRGFDIVAFITMGEGQASAIDDARIVSVNSLTDYADERNVEEIVVAIGERRGSLPVDQLLQCKLAGITVTDYSTFWERESGRVDLDTLHPSWLIFSDGFVGGRVQASIKRLFDLSVSLLFLIFTLPLTLAAAIAVRLDSPGGVLYRQERLGYHGQPFMLLKFRSMRVDAEKDGVPRWAAVNDARITRVGAFIRKTRIDELPQILNVFRGEMSFIGPRPERPFFVKQLCQKIPHYFERHRVKPGISGWAQLNYPYGASVEDAKCKFQYDLYYIKNYSLFIDLLVLIQTARVVLWPEGVR